MRHILSTFLAPLSAAFIGAISGTIIVHCRFGRKNEHLHGEKQYQDNLSKSRNIPRPIQSAIAFVLATGCLLAIGIIAIKLCVHFAYSNGERELIEKAIPLLEKIVWPLFVLGLIFIFEDELIKVFNEFPGLIGRSYLPYSPGPYKQETPTKNNIITEQQNSEDNHHAFNSSANTNETKEHFDQSEHEKEVSKIFKTISQEENVKIIPNVRILNSAWVCNGACTIGFESRYIAVLPKMFIERVPSVITRMNEAISLSKDKSSRRLPILMVCIYGFDSNNEIDGIDLNSFRAMANHSVVFRFFFKNQI